MTPEIAVVTAVDVFASLTNFELESMLNAAGVKPMKDKGLRVQQACNVWFHGFVPHTNAMIEAIRRHGL